MNRAKEHFVAVIGAGECGPEVAAVAHALGRLLAEAGYTLVCGGLGGVMQAASRGAREAGGRTIGILPGREREAANEFVDTALATGLGPMRNFLVVLNAEVVVAVEGSWGTLSELALAKKIGREVVAIGAWSNVPGVIPADGPQAALAAVRRILSIEAMS